MFDKLIEQYRNTGRLILTKKMKGIMRYSFNGGQYITKENALIRLQEYEKNVLNFGKVWTE